jgi:hypothetical protein
MKKSYLFLILILSFLLSNCNENKNDNLELESIQKQKTIDSLKAELNKDTDKKLFNEAFKLINEKKYEQAIVKLKEMKSKYPKSDLLLEADKNIELCNNKIEEKNKNEKIEYYEIVKICKTKDVEDAINELESFISKVSNKELIDKASKELEVYKKEYEKVKSERDFEKTYGIKIISVDTYWDVYWNWPVVKLKVKNISGKDIEWLSFNVQFLDRKSGSIYADGFTYISSKSDVPFGNGLTKVGKINGDKGIEKVNEIMNLPSITARIYIRDLEFKGEREGYKGIFYKEVPVNKKFGN